MASKSRQKGDREERAVVDTMTEAGCDARRMPLSGSVAGFEGDVEVTAPALGRALRVECKVRGDGFREIYKWLLEDHVDVLTLRADRKPRLYVLREADFIRLIGGQG